LQVAGAFSTHVLQCTYIRISSSAADETCFHLEAVEVWQQQLDEKRAKAVVSTRTA
jgi:hypothetical protein